MTIAFPCEKCGHRFEVDASLAGKKCKCKTCGHIFVIPVPRTAPAASSNPMKTFGSQGPASPSSSSSRTTAPAAKPARPTPPPAPPPAFDPYYDGDDPYATDDPPPVLTRRSNPAPQDDEEFLPPRGPKPIPVKTVKKKRRSDGSPFDQAPWWVFKIGAALTLASSVCCLFSVQTGLVLMGLFYFGMSLILAAMGGIGMTVVPFLESAVCGLMNLFVPVYPLYYLITRWDAMKRWFLTYLAGAGMFFPVLFLAIGLPALQVARNAAQAAQLRAEIDAAGPNDPRRAERQEALARLEASFRRPPQFANDPGPFANNPGAFRPPGPQPAPFGGPQNVRPNPQPDFAPGGPPKAINPPFPRRPFARKKNANGPPGPFAAAPPTEPGNGPAPAFGGPPSAPPDADFVTQALSDLKDSNALRRRGALGRLKDAPADESRRAEVAEAVEPLLGDPDGGTRTDAAKTLALWGSKDNTPGLVKALKDPVIWVRWAALDALAEIKDPSAAEAVAARLVDTKDKASVALKAMGREAEPAVVKYLSHNDLWVRTEACKILEEIGGSEECKLALVNVVRKANNFGFDADAAKSALQKIGMPTTRKKSIIPGVKRK